MTKNGVMTLLPAQHAGDQNHPEHVAWITELGRATFEAARVAGTCFDLARVLGGVDSTEMYSDPLGRLISRLGPLQTRATLPGMSAYLNQLEGARKDRNDLLHALPVADGLHRRKSDDPYYVRNFFDVEDLAVVTHSLAAAAAEGNRLLYLDGGQAIQDWYANATT